MDGIRPDRVEREHAERYAFERLRVAMYERYSALYPLLFGDVVFEKRPADPDRDYFVPAGLEGECVVADALRFGPVGCRKLGCFPFDEGLAPCDPGSVGGARWIRVGTGFALGCQPACAHWTVDAEFRSGRCWIVNADKKLLAALPESYFGMENRHNFHAGLDLVDGHLALNAPYCRSYGLSFRDGDCVPGAGQTLGEILLGRTLIRSMTKRVVRESDLPEYPPPARDLRWTNARARRAAPAGAAASRDAPSDEGTALLLARDLAVDYGVDLGLSTIRKFLRTRVPGLLVKMADRVAVRSAVAGMIARTYVPAAIALSKAAAKAASVVGSALVAIDAVALVLDMFDPFEFNRVLHRDQVELLDLQSDAAFFHRTDRLETEITVDAFWNILETDLTEQALFVSDRIEEYLLAVHADPPKDHLPGRSLFRRAGGPGATRYAWDEIALSGCAVLLLALSAFAIDYLMYFCLLILAAYVVHDVAWKTYD